MSRVQREFKEKLEVPEHDHSVDSGTYVLQKTFECPECSEPYDDDEPERPWICEQCDQFYPELKMNRYD